MSALADAIKSLAPAARFSFKDEDLTTLEWLDASVERPSDADILAARDAFQAGIPLKLLRMERTRLLAETDWTQGADVPSSVKELWAPYRQALRDITDTYSSLDDVVWPTKPE